jgi:hypothetical protein
MVALLQKHPEGLSPVQTRQMLGIDKDLGSMMKAMVRDGLLRRVATGWYGVPSRPEALDRDLKGIKAWTRRPYRRSTT